jgi:peptidoglycan/LPS O-acetylase OafA/YrhL
MQGEAVPNHSRRIPGFDGLRGIGILFVLIGHGAYSFPIKLGPTFPYFGNGMLGVNVFFVLSGYLIYMLSVREYERTGQFDWVHFYLRRVLRIFPCFYSYLAVIAILMGLGLVVLSPSMIIAVSTFSLNYRQLWDPSTIEYNYSVICHYWTLTLEEQFYLTFPFLMFLFARRWLLPVMATVVILAPFIRVFCYFFTPGSRAQIGMMFHTGFDSIAMGVLLGELLRRPRWKERLLTLAGNPKVLASLLVFLFVISPALTSVFRGSYSITIGKTLELLAIAIVVTAAAFHSSRTMSAVIEWPPLVYLGVLSYSLYVWNLLFLNVQLNWVVNQFPLNFILLAITVSISYYLVERPFLRLKDVLRNRRRTPEIGLARPAE